MVKGSPAIWAAGSSSVAPLGLVYRCTAQRDCGVLLNAPLGVEMMAYHGQYRLIDRYTLDIPDNANTNGNTPDHQAFLEALKTHGCLHAGWHILAAHGTPASQPRGRAREEQGTGISCYLFDHTAPRELPFTVVSMAGYDDQAEDLYYFDDNTGSFDQDLVYALDAGMRHSVNQALVQAIQPFKHHLLGLVDQQAWSAPAGTPSLAGPSLSEDTQSAKQSPNPHAADFQSLLRNMAREHDYNAGSLKKAVDAPASSSASSGHSSEQEDAPPRNDEK
ncbi:hypothetical protein NDU88_001902 [Pleurodeles waltl]|uniref:Uncharacterized protein n=1 Tax=Pleurodeles waltl TaxID=8319 RepID=A0AAV7LCQ5_PLEWA|nr:hypothetical protein NDU88_001902 [Pleurodeles waltl]